MSDLTFNINHLQHIGIPVTDIKRSEAFYQRLGFETVMTAPFTIDNEKGICIMMKRDHIMMEFYQMPEAQLKEIRTRGNGHIDHIAFDVNDIDQAFAELKSKNFQVVEDAPVFLPTFWSKGCKYFNILGPDGERLEFNQIL
jgi:lactoylglutathione lyase